MAYLILDTETTGLFDWGKPAEADGQPRLASWAMLFVDDDLEIEDRHDALVTPDGWEMTPQAQAINGLTQERLLAEGRPVRRALQFLQNACDDKRILVAHNLSFDAKIMRGELRRAGLNHLTDRVGPGICTMRALTPACALAKPNGGGLKFPRLQEACHIILNREIPGAHNALVDAKACLWLLRAMRERGLLDREAA